MEKSDVATEEIPKMQLWAPQIQKFCSDKFGKIFWKIPVPGRENSLF